MKRKKHLRQLKHKRHGKRLLLLVAIFIAAIGLTWGGVRIYAQVAGAPPITVPSASAFVDKDGEKIGDHFANERRYWVELEDVSPFMIDALLSVEDHTFYEHNGFNVKRIAGAIIANIKSGGKAQGASTITQQFARNLYLSHEKTWTRKLHEALYAYRLEIFYSKDDILEGYLNTVYFGHGMYGVEAASRYYFGKAAKDLTLAEASLLAGVPKGPSIYSPIVDIDKSKERQAIILALMVENEKITEADKTAAQTQEIALKNDAFQDKNSAPYFLDVAWQEASEILRKKQMDISEGGWVVKTTLNQKHQEAADFAVANRMPEGELQVSFVSIEPKTGAVTAMVGGRNYSDSPFNRATQAQRQPGSTLKPFLYAAALEKRYNPLTFLDVPQTTFTFDGNEKYTPKNANDKFAEHEISMTQALALSDNIYAVKVLEDIGYKAFRDIGKRFDLPIGKANSPRIALGSEEMSLYRLTTAYNRLASSGKAVTPTTILSITNNKGEIVYEYEPPEEVEQALSKADSFLVTTMMQAMFNPNYNDYAYVTGNDIAPYLTQDSYAAKTGTTNSDQWIVGYSPSITAGVWNGYDQGKNLDGGVTKYIWLDFMERVNAGKKQSFKKPKGISEVKVEIKSGKLASRSCDKQATVFVKNNDVPTERCIKFDIFDVNTWDSFFDSLPSSILGAPSKR